MYVCRARQNGYSHPIVIRIVVFFFSPNGKNEAFAYAHSIWRLQADLVREARRRTDLRREREK